MIYLNNYKKTIVLSLISVGFIILFFIEPSSMGKGVRNGLFLCGETVIPSLFPFMIFSDFLVRSELANSVGGFVSPITEKLFKLPGCSACAVIMSLIGGFPVGTRMISQLLDSRAVSASQAKRMMWFCVNSGPAFVIGAVGATMLASRKCGIILFISQTSAALIIGFLSRFFGGENEKQEPKKVGTINACVLTESVSCATAAMLNVCAWILAFSAFVPFLTELSEKNEMFGLVILTAEVTGGCAFAAEKLPSFLIAPILCWSGLAVHMQLLPYIKNIGMSLPEFWLSRLVNGIVVLPISFVLFKLFPSETQVFLSLTDVVVKTYSVSVPASVAMLVLGAFTIIDINLATEKKV